MRPGFSALRGAGHSGPVVGRSVRGAGGGRGLRGVGGAEMRRFVFGMRRSGGQATARSRTPDFVCRGGRGTARRRGGARCRDAQGACPLRSWGGGARVQAEAAGQVRLLGGSPLWRLGDKGTRRVFQWCVRVSIRWDQ